MDSETPLSLPTIEFSTKLKPGTPEWDSVKGQVRQALGEFGCFEALFDKVPLDTRKALSDTLKELFDLPLEAKHNTYNLEKPYLGYVGQLPFTPLYECLAIEDPTDHEKVETLSAKMWTQGKQSFCKSIESYSDQLSELDQTIRKMVLEILGLDKYLEEHMEESHYILRVMVYHAPETTETAMGLLPHTDKTLVSILSQLNDVVGLDVETKDGQWINVKPAPNSFIVMFGDLFYAWSNGKVHAPRHRVLMKGNEARYSAGLFSVTKDKYLIKAPEEVVDEQHPLLFKPFGLEEFLKFYYSEVGMKSGNAMKVYCAI
ncbi:hypothetical protein UlMin_017455 [Ulmus minor]